VHTEEAKKRKKVISEIDYDMQFYSEKLCAEKRVRHEYKSKLFQQRKEFDSLYLKAQEFI